MTKKVSPEIEKKYARLFHWVVFYYQKNRAIRSQKKLPENLKEDLPFEIVFPEDSDEHYQSAIEFLDHAFFDAKCEYSKLSGVSILEVTKPSFVPV